MKSRFTKILATTLAMTMCIPTAAFAASTTTPAINGATEGSFNTSFGVYSPKLTVSVPLKADIQVNPMAKTSETGVGKFTIASNSIDVLNASVDADADKGIPVNVTVKATITSQKADVVTEYNTFTVDKTSTKKRVNLNLSTAQTAAVVGVKTGGTAAFDSEKKLDLSQYAVTTAAIYTTPADSTPVTKYGSLLSVDIGAPTTTNTTANATFTTAAADVKPTVGSIAVTGEANTYADWKADDIAVAITYNVKASETLNIKTPKVATAPAPADTTADVPIIVPNVGEATVTAIALHNDNSYKDIVWESAAENVTYAPNASTSTQTDATITIKKEDATLGVLAEDEFKGKVQDLVIALSDGRMVVTTIKVGN